MEWKNLQSTRRKSDVLELYERCSVRDGAVSFCYNEKCGCKKKTEYDMIHESKFSIHHVYKKI